MAQSDYRVIVGGAKFCLNFIQLSSVPASSGLVHERQSSAKKLVNHEHPFEFDWPLAQCQEVDSCCEQEAQSGEEGILCASQPLIVVVYFVE